ncbi:MAG: hypothetical protein JWR62_1453 [Modestobacter sp.]|jgi:hypothetical protein|nr:hypothetical protein [Modestobacter sp.]
MRNGRWWVLLLLAAVFSMHGVQCLDGDGPATSAHAMSLDTTSLDTTSPGGRAPDPTTGTVAAEPPGAPSAGDAPTSHADHAAPGVTAVGGASAGGHPAGPMNHLWAACLAILSAGLAVWLAIRVPRPVTTASRPETVARLVAARHARPPRPPDIYALCVLRT